jgi:hypothetical protein
MSLLKLLSKEELDQLPSNVALESISWHVSNEKNSSIIRKFRDLGVNFVLSFTTDIGQKGINIAKKLLHERKIDLNSQNFPFAHLDFNEFKEYKKHFGSYPFYDNGIIISNEIYQTVAFFKRLMKIPKTVILVTEKSTELVINFINIMKITETTGKFSDWHDITNEIEEKLKTVNNLDNVKYIICKYPIPEISEQEFVDFWRSKIGQMRSSK